MNPVDEGEPPDEKEARNNERGNEVTSFLIIIDKIKDEMGPIKNRESLRPVSLLRLLLEILIFLASRIDSHVTIILFISCIFYPLPVSIFYLLLAIFFSSDSLNCCRCFTPLFLLSLPS